jgi:alpha-L-fucosidase 2
MKRRTFTLGLLAALSAAGMRPRRSRAQQRSHGPMPETTDRNRDVILWYDQPAPDWNHALPIGNGRLGAMVFGGVGQERIQLNEETLWDGHPMDHNNPEALKYLPEVRRLIFSGKNREAEALCEKHLLGVPCQIKSYQSLGDLLLDFGDLTAESSYRRELDLDTATARTTFTSGGIAYERQAFVSAPDDVIVLRLLADQPGTVNVRIRLTRGEVRGQKSDAPNQTLERIAEGDARLILRGQIEDRPEGVSHSLGRRFEAEVVVRADGGRVRADGDALVVDKAVRVTLLIAAATDYRRGDPERQCRDRLATTLKRAYGELREKQLTEHHHYFRRVSLDLGGPDRAQTPTDARLAAVKEGADDPGLAALYFQYGRYLLLTSSRLAPCPRTFRESGTST